VILARFKGGIIILYEPGYNMTSPDVDICQCEDLDHLRIVEVEDVAQAT
jgi:hypothetical protein